MIYTGKIRNMNQIIVSDPGYEEGVWCRYEKTDFPSVDWTVDISINNYDEEVEGYNLKGVEFQIMLRNPDVRAKIGKESFSYPKNLKVDDYVIGMDHARVSLGINEKADEIRAEKDAWDSKTALLTLTDGEFGIVCEGKMPICEITRFIYISGYLDEDTGYSIQDVIDYLTENLQIEDLKQNIESNQTEIESFLVDTNGIDVGLATWFDVNAKFGTNVSSEENTWVDLYAVYNPLTDEVSCTYCVDTPKGVTDHKYEPTIYEKDMIKELIEDYCLKEENMTAKEFFESFLAEEGMSDLQQ